MGKRKKPDCIQVAGANYYPAGENRYKCVRDPNHPPKVWHYCVRCLTDPARRVYYLFIDFPGESMAALMGIGLGVWAYSHPAIKQVAVTALTFLIGGH